MEWIIDALNFIIVLNATFKSMSILNDSEYNINYNYNCKSNNNIVGLNMNVEISGISNDNTTWDAMENVFKLVNQAIFVPKFHYRLS